MWKVAPMKSSTKPILIRRPADERGRADHGWLQARFTFSFADYQDPDHMGFKSLRVMNNDTIQPGGGFPTHPHREMEIFTYVVEGRLEHRDSMGNGAVIEPGNLQSMTTGDGLAVENASEVIAFAPEADSKLLVFRLD